VDKTLNLQPQSDIKTDSVESILDDKFIRKNKAEFPEVAELDNTFN
jgi:glycine dehydrogenase subunit 2